MRKVFKKAISVLLVAVMVFSVVAFDFSTLSDLSMVKAVQTSDLQVGDIIEFGSYPQTKVTDESLIAQLNKQTTNWKSYNYCCGTGEGINSVYSSDYMKFSDVVFNDEQYRAVKFSSYRPYKISHTSQASLSFQDDNGYECNVVYWFKYEPIKWRVLDPENGLVVSETIIDVQPYCNTMYFSGSDSFDRYAHFNNIEKTYYANNYEKSSMRIWLTDNFYNTAFDNANKTHILKTTLNNDGYNTLCGKTGYKSFDGAETTDTVFLLSYDESINPKYGFSTSKGADSSREAYTSDYAKCQGIKVENNGKSCWELRSSGSYSRTICCVNEIGETGTNFGDLYGVDTLFSGIRPALRLNRVSVTGIDIHESKIQMNDDTMVISATVYPENATNKKIKWSSSNPDVAAIDATNGTLTAKSNGYTVVTATSADGFFTDSCLVFVGKNTMVVSSEDGNEIVKGDTHKVYVSLLDMSCMSLTDNGVARIDTISDDPIDKTVFTVEDSSVATIKSIREWNHNGRILEIKGVSIGTTYITMTNNDTGEVKYLPIYVIDEENTYTTETIPEIDEGYSHRGIKNFRHSGIYIYDYQKEDNDDGSVDVKFNAYNKNTNNGSIEVYDENGTIVKSYMLEAHNGGDPTSVDENCEMVGAILATWVNLDPYDPTSMVSSTKTEVDCTVPKNGYIKITNDVTDSKICLVYNIMDLVVSTVSLSKDVMGLVDLGPEATKKVVEKTSEKVIEAILDTSGSTITKIIEEIIDELSKPETKDNREDLFDLVEQLLDVIDLRFEEIFVETIWDVTQKKITDLGLEALGVYGKLVEGAYAYNAFLQLYNLIEESNASIDSRSAYIYAQQSGDKKVSNGIIFNGKVDAETIFRTYAIAYGDIYVEASTLYGAEDMELYDISLVKNGNTVQPSENVQVRIPIPKDWNKNKVKVYRVTLDGAYMQYEDMKGKVDGNYIVFETDHFSYYVIVDETEVEISIRNPSTTTISYGDSMILHADLSEALPSGWNIEWTASNENFSYSVSDDGLTCTISPSSKGDTTFTATVYDAEDKEVCKDEQTMTSKAGFFDKIIAFFKKLFGATKVIPQAFKGIF